MRRIRTTEKGHGRIEERTLRTVEVTPEEVTWPGARQVCQLVRKRYYAGKPSKETVYLVTSLSPKQAGPERLLQLSRDHWAIENRLHCVRDITFREDACRARTGAIPQTFAALRNTALTCIRKLGFPSAIQGIEHFAERRWMAIRLIHDERIK